VKEKAILSYSGGLDTSILVKWIREKYDVNVATVTVDVGQGDDFKAIEEKAMKVGAVKHYFIDAKKEFASDYIHPAIKANALYEGKYPLSTALSRPLIATKLVEIAKKEKAQYVAHGCSGKGNDQVRFDITIKAKAPNMRILAPIREWKLTRAEEITYAREHGIEIPVGLEKPYSIDQSLWGKAIECGILEDPYQEPPDEIFALTARPENTPDIPEIVKISFSNGVPVAVNDRKENPVSLIETVNRIAGRHGVGRIDHIEDRLVGIKSREIYECPGATVILEAHKDLEKSVMTRHEAYFKEIVDREWTNLVYNGLWVDPLKTDLEAFINAIQPRVEGDVKVKLFKGTAIVVGRRSPYSLYSKKLAAYDAESTFDQKWSEGFIELWGLPSRTASRVKGRT